MWTIRRVAGIQLSSETFDARISRVACFTAGPTLLVLALLGVARFATTPSEVLLGVLGSLTLSLLLVVLGMVLPMRQRKTA